jgi:LysM repeat protein
LALLATIAGTYLVADNALDGGRVAHPSKRHPHSAQRPQIPVRTVNTATTPTTETAPAKYYLIRPGDSLYAISQRVHVALATLVALNPGVSPTSLRVGQRLTIRR